MKEYMFNVLDKVIANITSVKVWILGATLLVSTIILYDGHISGGEWVGINTSITTTIVGMREIFKVEKVRRLKKENDIKNVKE